jgi:hypothetical protein
MTGGAAPDWTFTEGNEGAGIDSMGFMVVFRGDGG